MKFSIKDFSSKCDQIRSFLFLFLIFVQWKGRKQGPQESLYAFVVASLLGWLINPGRMFNKISPNPVR